MNRILLAIIGVTILNLRLPAQSIDAELDQLAALNTLRKSIQQGYNTMTTGLTTIGAIRQSEYGRHSKYNDDLDAVQPEIPADAKLQAIRTQLTQLITTLQSTLDYWKKQPTN